MKNNNQISNLSRTAQGLAGVVVSAAFLALHYSGLLALPPETLGTMLVGLLASLGWTGHGVSRRLPRGPYAKPDEARYINDDAK